MWTQNIFRTRIQLWIPKLILGVVHTMRFAALWESRRLEMSAEMLRTVALCFILCARKPEVEGDPLSIASQALLRLYHVSPRD